MNAQLASYQNVHHQIMFSHFAQAIKSQTMYLSNVYCFPHSLYNTVARPTPFTQPQISQAIQLPNRPIYSPSTILETSKVQHIIQPIKPEKFIAKALNIKSEPIKLEATSIKVENSASLSEENKDANQVIKSPKPVQELSPSQFMKSELEKILTFLLSNMGKASQVEIDNMREHYLKSKNQMLLSIFDKLVIKYFSAKRCKEDIIRYILRRVFKGIKLSIIKNEKVPPKQANVVLCRKYFQNTFEKLKRSGLDLEDDDKLFDLVMPYSKESRNKTMNTKFVLEIFDSEGFCTEYDKFLKDLDRILVADNHRKRSKLVEFLLECVKSNSVEKIARYKRLPWLDTWMEDTKQIAISLRENTKETNCGLKRVEIDS